jgi:hypothetical protein
LLEKGEINLRVRLPMVNRVRELENEKVLNEIYV